MKKIAIIIITLITFSNFNAKAQAEAAIPAIVAGAVELTKKINMKKVKWGLTGFRHRKIYVRYEDGTEMYNTPRSYRTPTEVLSHHMQPKYTNSFGRVVDFQMVYNGKWRRILKK